MISVNRHTLNNGLRIVHHYDPTVAMATVNIIYNVGSRDESPSLTGMAHLFEHLMFGGSVNISDFDACAEAAGGFTNAWTSNDFTSFYQVLPAVNVETAFWLESDRMMSLSFNPQSLEVQRHVVIEEFKEVCLNKPFGDMMHHLRALIYRTHPYRYPTIGKEISHIENVTMEDVRTFFFSHYAPNNAVLAVAGNVTFDRVCSLAEKWFGAIPRRRISTRDYFPEKAVEAPRRMDVTGKVPCTQMVMAFPMCGYSSEDFAPTDLLSDVLSSGRSARFHQRLLMSTDLFSEIDASVMGSDEPGVFMVTARLTANDDVTVEKARRAISDQLSDIADNGCTPHELRRALNRYESNLTFGTIGCMEQASALAQAEIENDDVNASLERYRAVTTEDIHRVACEVLDPHREMTLVYRPE